jgi:hypothetical protein
LNRFKKIALYTLSSLAGIALLGAILTRVYEDDIKQFAIAKINEYLDAEISAEEVDFTLFKRFPNASLRFKNVLLKDKINTNDTIIFAQDLYLKMSIWDVIDKNYNVNAIEVNTALLNLHIDKNGKENYIFWKQDDVRDSISDFSFNLNQVTFKKTHIKYVNSAILQDYHFYANNLTLNGEFSSDEFTLKSNADLYAHYFKSEGITYLANQPCVLSTEMNVNTLEKAVKINFGDLKIADISFRTGGYYNYGASFIEYVIMGNDIKIISLLSAFPEDFFKDISNYNSKGILAFSASIKGRSNKTETPIVEANFEIADGSLTETKNKITLSELFLKGKYTSANKEKSSQLNVETFSGKFQDGYFNGSINVTDLTSPSIVLNCSGNLNLNTLYQFFPSNKLKSLSGNIDFSTSIAGKFQEEDFSLKHSEGNVDFKQLAFELTDNDLVFTELSGNFQLKKNHAHISNLKGKISNTAISVEGYFQNFLPYILLPNEKLVVEADVWVGNANLKELMEKSTPKTSSENTSTPNVDMSFRLHAEQIIYGKLQAQNIKANVQIIDKNIYYQNLTFNATKGNYESSGELLMLKNSNYIFSGTASAKQVDAPDFFNQLDDFGQEYLTHKNIKGLVDADIKFSFQLTPNFDILKNTIVSSTNLLFAKGELIDVPLINEIAEYMVKDWKVKPFLDEKLLVQKAKHIKFQELALTVIIQNEIIHIPYTKVKSSLIDINGEGTHGFNDDINYKFDFLLKDILVKKQPDTEEFSGYELEEKSGLRVFVKVDGTVEKPKYGYDMISHKKYREMVKEQEKNNVKSILKDEFGLFKKDTSLLAKPKEEQAKAKFVVDWDEMDKEERVDSTSINSKKNIEEKEKKKTERMDRFVKKLGGEQNKETETKFKIDE